MKCKIKEVKITDTKVLLKVLCKVGKHRMQFRTEHFLGD